jgi:hypothetical protein
MGNTASEYWYGSHVHQDFTPEQLKSLQDGVKTLRHLQQSNRGYDHFAAINRDRHCHAIRQSALLKKKTADVNSQTNTMDFHHARSGNIITVASWVIKWYTLEHRCKPKITKTLCKQHRKSQEHRKKYMNGTIPPAPAHIKENCNNRFSQLMFAM